MSSKIRLKTKYGNTVVGTLSKGAQVNEAKLLAEAHAYKFCQPLCEVRKTCDLLVGTDQKALKKRMEMTEVSAWSDALGSACNLHLRSVNGIFIGRDEDQESMKERDLSQTYLGVIKNRLREIYRTWDAPSDINAFLYVLLPIVMISDTFAPGENLQRDVAAAFRAGFIPYFWSGKWPNGYLEVFCPPDRPHAKLGTIDPVKMKAKAKHETAEGRRKYREHPGFIDAPSVSIKHLEGWKKLFVHDRKALSAHFAPLVSNLQDRQALAIIMKRVERVAIVRGCLEIHLLDGEGSDLIMRCRPPFTAALTHVPADLVPLLHVHNGMKLDEPSEAVEWFAFDGAKFVPDEDERDAIKGYSIYKEEPWCLAPLLVPLTNGQDFYVYHPTEPTADGRARLVWVSHETLRMEDQESGIGGMFLQMVASRLVIE